MKDFKIAFITKLAKIRRGTSLFSNKISISYWKTEGVIIQMKS